MVWNVRRDSNTDFLVAVCNRAIHFLTANVLINNGNGDTFKHKRSKSKHREENLMAKNKTTENINTTFYDSIVLQMINNKAFSTGLIDEKTKMHIERQIMQSVSTANAK